MTLNDLTKQELLELIICRGLNRSINIRDIKRVRYNTMTCNAKKMADEACAEMKTRSIFADYEGYMKASDKFDKAMKLYEESSKFIEINTE